MQHAREKIKTGDPELELRIQGEIEFARAWTALILAARLDEAETRAEEAYRQIVGDARVRPGRRIIS